MNFVFGSKTTVKLNDCHQLPVLSCSISHAKFLNDAFLVKALFKQMGVVDQVF
jgi:hypothetical protein